MIMTTLLVSVFGVFWFHTFLWWRKDFWEKRELRAKGIFFPQHVRPDEAGHIYRRFSTFDIVLHFTMMVTFIGLVLTGLPLKFSHAPWAGALMHFMGGATLAGLIHRICATITFASSEAFWTGFPLSTMERYSGYHRDDSLVLQQR
jgi:hypothetical protein